MDIKKISGWVLLAAGLIIIAWAMYSSYSIFTGKTFAPEIFKLEQAQNISASQTGGNQVTEAQLQKMIGDQLKGLIPANALEKILNLTVWSLLAFLLIFGGTQIATLGIKLLNKV